ncbi:MAG: DUF2608 domain-containing protein [Chlamydiales bacterium]
MNHQLPPPTHLEYVQYFGPTSERCIEAGCDVVLKRSNSSQIFSAENLNLIEQIIENADQDTLVLFDVDQTLITPDDPILKPKYDKLLDDLMGGKKFITDESGKTRYIFREILMHAPHSLIDPKSLVLVQKLQAKGVPVVAFSAAPGGKIGEVDSFVDWRINELHHFGFDFQSIFPHIQTLELPKDTDLEFPPIYKSGVLITSLHDKGPVLLNFFKESNWTPKKVIFIDDQMSNIRSVIESLEGHTETIGIHYTGASLIPCALENKAAKYQVEHFLKTGNWISQAEAMIENEASAVLVPALNGAAKTPTRI